MDQQIYGVRRVCVFREMEAVSEWMIDWIDNSRRRRRGEQCVGHPLGGVEMMYNSQICGCTVCHCNSVGLTNLFEKYWLLGIREISPAAFSFLAPYRKC